MTIWQMIAIAAIVVVAALIGVISVKYLGPDNPVEKAAEQVIKSETGVDVNLTPDQPAPAAPAQPPPAVPK